MRKIKQFCYYGDDNPKNSLVLSKELINSNHLLSGSIFTNYTPIIKLGIQSLPGTRFYLNGSVNPIIIGPTGLYELELSDNIQVSSLSFARGSLQSISNLDNAVLIIDIVYEEGED